MPTRRRIDGGVRRQADHSTGPTAIAVTIEGRPKKPRSGARSSDWTASAPTSGAGPALPFGQPATSPVSTSGQGERQGQRRGRHPGRADRRGRSPGRRATEPGPARARDAAMVTTAARPAASTRSTPADPVGATGANAATTAGRRRPGPSTLGGRPARPPVPAPSTDPGSWVRHGRRAYGPPSSGRRRHRRFEPNDPGDRTSQVIGAAGGPVGKTRPAGRRQTSVSTNPHPLRDILDRSPHLRTATSSSPRQPTVLGLGAAAHAGRARATGRHDLGGARPRRPPPPRCASSSPTTTVWPRPAWPPWSTRCRPCPTSRSRSWPRPPTRAASATRSRPPRSPSRRPRRPTATRPPRSRGTPADSVLYAVEVAMPLPPHVVVSGTNLGQNLGDITTISGTVGAARTANRLGIPGHRAERRPRHQHRDVLPHRRVVRGRVGELLPQHLPRRVHGAPDAERERARPAGWEACAASGRAARPAQRRSPAFTTTLRRRSATAPSPERGDQTQPAGTERRLHAAGLQLRQRHRRLQHRVHPGEPRSTRTCSRPVAVARGALGCGREHGSPSSG